MRKIFSADDIDAIMLDIEGIGLPLEFNHPVLRLVLGVVEVYSGQLHYGIDFAAKDEERIEMTYGRAGRPDEVPDFLKEQAAREGWADKPDPNTLADAIRNAEAIMAKRLPRTAVAPQEDFSSAPLPDALRADPQDVPAPAEDPDPAPTLKGVELKTGPWSQEDEDHLLAQRTDGVPFKDIALQLNRPLAATNAKHSNLMKAMAAPAKKPAAKPKPTPQSTFYTGPWSSEDEQYLMELRAKGVPFMEIARKLNRPQKGVTQKFYNLRDAAKKPVATPAPTPASKHIGKITSTAPEMASKAEGGAGVLPRPCPDKYWPIEDDFDLVSEHHRGISMLDVSITLERTKPACVARYNALMDAMPAGPFTERQIKLKKTLSHYASLPRAGA